MESKQILDQQISASSEKYPSSRARINKWGAWLPVETDFVNPWIEVNFILVVRVAKILTQGRSGTSQWVTKYAVSYWKMDRYYNLTEQDRRIKVITKCFCSGTIFIFFIFFSEIYIFQFVC